MKIGIVTVHRANNYGAAVQAYALQHILRNYGLDAQFIDYVGDFLKYPFGIENFRKKGLVGETFTFLGELSRLPRRKKFNEFRKSYFICTEEVKKEELCGLEEQFDLFIAGSDQVWNYKITNQDGAYLLDFVKNYDKKGSYAASFGLTRIERKYREWYSQNLSNIKYLNIREKSAIPIVKKYTNRTPKVVLDPTLLLAKTEWEKIAVNPKMQGDYILSYQVGIDRHLVKYTAFLSKATGLPVYSIPFTQGGYIKMHPVWNSGPLEWLGWIKNARYVVTDSFHGMALSIIFERNFAVNISSQGQALSSRLKDLLNLTGIKGRNIDEIGNIVVEEIDYSKVNIKLEKHKKYSLGVIEGMVLDAKGEGK